MMRRRGFAAIALVCTTFVSAAAQETVKQLPARVELQELRIAQGAGRLPVVVFMSGAGGIPGGIDLLTSEFNSIGISTFVVDPFAGRGVVSVLNDNTRLDRLTAIVDAYRVLQMLAVHPRVDPNRIALMGASYGGHTALYASLRRFQKMWSTSGVEYAAYIPFYASCARIYLSDTDTSDHPIRMFHGTGDDWNPIAPCRAYVQRLRAAGRDVELTEYPDARHGFDYAVFPAMQLVADAQVGGFCAIHEDRAGVLINTATMRPFPWADACVTRGAHVGFDSMAAAASHLAVDGFLKSLFKLK
jgi:dienelactone hydrolase